MSRHEEEREGADEREERAPPSSRRREEETAAEWLAQHLGASGGEESQAGYVSIFRAPDRPGSRFQFLETVPVDLIQPDPLEAIQERWGGGRFRLRLKNKAHHYVSGGSHHFEIAGKPKQWDRTHDPDTEERMSEIESRVAARLGDGDESSAPQILRYIMEEMRELAREVRNPPPGAAQANPADMAVALMSAFQQSQAPLLEALIARREEPARERSRMSEFREMLEMMQLMRELSGDGSPAGAMSTLTKELGPRLGTLIDRHLSETPNGGRTLPPPAQPNPPTGGTPDMAQYPPWLRAIQPHFPNMNQWAQQDRDPEACADFLFSDFVTESAHLFPEIYEELSAEGFVDRLAAQVPPVAVNLEWFRAFIGRTVANLEYYLNDVGGEGEEDTAPEVGGGEGAPDAESV